MPNLEFGGKVYDVDEEGYLQNPEDWSKELAMAIAKTEDIEMTEAQWEVVNFLRNYYKEYQIAPMIKILIKEMAKMFGPEKGNNKYLYELFPAGPAKQACKIGGLPKPTGCV